MRFATERLFFVYLHRVNFLEVMNIFIRHILRVLLLLAMLSVAWSCNRSVKFDIDGRLLENAASKVYLIIESDKIDTLASTTVAADNTFCLRGQVAEPTTAFLCDDNGNTLSVLLIEQAQLYLRPLPEGGYIAEGGPINDKYNLVMQRLSDVARQISELDTSSPEAAEAYESLIFRYHDILSTAITDNLDNIIGVELFLSQEARGMSADDMRVRMMQFSPEMQSLSAMKDFARYIDTYARTEVGNKYIDVEVVSATDGKTSLKEICGKGNWVLLDFWATWCEPCLAERPLMREIYAKYAVQGLEICSISLDNDPRRWREFIRENDMLWTNVIDIHANKQQSAAAAYGLQAIPANFLLSPEGVIVARNLHGEMLCHELEHIFGECVCSEQTADNQ